VSTPSLSPERIAALAVTRLKEKADPEKAKGAQRYFKDTVKCFGLSSADVRAIAAELYQAVRQSWQVEEAIRLCDILLPRAELESKGIASLILPKYKKAFPRSLFFQVKEWLVNDYLNNWASVDVLCPDVIGALLLQYPDLRREIKTWTGDPNRWVRRASIVSFIKLAKKAEFLDLVYEISGMMFAVADDLIQKANGWLLREAGKADMDRLERFLLSRGPSIPRTTLRYAIERFEAIKRKKLLVETKA
jgi:3-methyladenine DNA glycosylase AlkD